MVIVRHYKDQLFGDEPMLATQNTQNLSEDRNGHTIANPKGTRVSVRLVQPSDLALIDEMHDRLSKDSLYYRYLGPNKPTAKDLQRLCSSYDGAGAVLVATVEEPQEKVVGVACYQVNPQNPSTAEPAVLVEDSYQGCGLGKKIILALCQHAIQRGIKSFDTYIHPVNHRMLAIIKGSGLNYESRYSDGLKEIRVWLNSVA